MNYPKGCVWTACALDMACRGASRSESGPSRPRHERSSRVHARTAGSHHYIPSAFQISQVGDGTTVLFRLLRSCLRSANALRRHLKHCVPPTITQ